MVVEKSFEFLFGKIPKYPKMDISIVGIFVCSFTISNLMYTAPKNHEI